MAGASWCSQFRRTCPSYRSPTLRDGRVQLDGLVDVGASWTDVIHTGCIASRSLERWTVRAAVGSLTLWIGSPRDERAWTRIAATVLSTCCQVRRTPPPASTAKAIPADTARRAPAGFAFARGSGLWRPTYGPRRPRSAEVL